MSNKIDNNKELGTVSFILCPVLKWFLKVSQNLKFNIYLHKITYKLKIY